MSWWGGGKKQQEHQDHSSSSSGSSTLKKDDDRTGIVSSTLHVVQDVAADAAGTEAVLAVGAEQRESGRMESREKWGRIKEGDTLWSLSEKYLGDGSKWPHLHAACRKELGPDPLLILPGTHVTEVCVARARELSRKSNRK